MKRLQRRRFLIAGTAVLALLPAGTGFAAETKKRMRIGVIGSGRIGGTLSVSKSAHWQGDISARQAVLAGRVTGKIVVEDKLEISSSAVIQGEIVAKILAIANGARIEGEVTVTSGKAIVKFDEKRTSDAA